MTVAVVNSLEFLQAALQILQIIPGVICRICYSPAHEAQGGGDRISGGGRGGAVRAIGRPAHAPAGRRHRHHRRSTVRQRARYRRAQHGHRRAQRRAARSRRDARRARSRPGAGGPARRGRVRAAGTVRSARALRGRLVRRGTRRRVHGQPAHLSGQRRDVDVSGGRGRSRGDDGRAAPDRARRADRPAHSELRPVLRIGPARLEGGRRDAGSHSQGSRRVGRARRPGLQGQGHSTAATFCAHRAKRTGMA